jgi:flagellar hook-associated protein 3 FlgL
MQRTQMELVQANKELVSGRVADVGLALGARTGVSVSMHREMDRLAGLMDSNGLASSRLSSIQEGLQQLTEAANLLLTDLATASNGATDPGVTRQQAESVLSMMTSVLNGNLNGEHLYAGINTDVRPLNDFLDPNSANRMAFDAAFAAYPFADPANITSGEMDAFLTSVEGQFLGAGWNGVWSTATDQEITSRITLTETAQTSVSANIPGFRKLAMAAATVAATFDGNLSEAGREVVLDRAINLLGQVVSDLANEQGKVGITEQRIDKASERMSMQIDLFKTSLLDLEGVDENEAAVRVTGLKAQLELSYSLTSQMMQLSLLRYLS